MFLRVIASVVAFVIQIAGNQPSHSESVGTAPTASGAVLRFEHHPEAWILRGDTTGLSIEVERGKEKTTVRPQALADLKQINRISAVKTETKVVDGHCLGFVGIAVECISPNHQRYEYRMAECLLPDGIWSVSDVLTTRPVDSPFQSIAAGLPGGDSLTMTLQLLQRRTGTGTEPDAIETHTFVNHCPAPEPMFSKLTQHYVSRSSELIPATQSGR